MRPTEETEFREGVGDDTPPAIGLALMSSPKIKDLEPVVSKLAANAIRHSRSGVDGGTYTDRIPQPPT